MAATRTVAGYGSWTSPLTSASIVSSGVTLSRLRVPAPGTVCWVEGRPLEGGRYALVLSRGGADGDGSIDVLPPNDVASPGGRPFNSRTRVHEYGGDNLACLVDEAVGKLTLVFSNFSDQRLYSVDAAIGAAEEAAPISIVGDAPVPLTPADRPWRYADASVDAARGRMYVVREDHTKPAPADVVNEIVAVPFASHIDDPGRQVVLASGYDFYAAPRLSPDGTQLAYLAWNHPYMPWDNSSLFVASLDADGAVAGTTHVNADFTETEESVIEPRWAPDGSLYFISDRSGVWSLYRCVLSGGAPEVKLVYSSGRDLGCGPWVVGANTYGFVDGGAQVLVVVRDGLRSGLALVDTADGTVVRETESGGAADITDLVVDAARGLAYFVGGAPTRESAAYRLDIASNALTAITPSGAAASDKPSLDGYLSEPRLIEFATAGDVTAFANYYAPRNKDYVAPDGEKPPLLCKIHGGPTGIAKVGFRSDIQYWTSRGFGVVDVNYGGSLYFGRDYRRRLNGQWGVVDVQDCAAAVQHLVSEGLADSERTCVTGGSAGGFTALALLAQRGDVFTAGASHYGVTDLMALAGDTHKFESRYLDRLVGELPRDKAIYDARSPTSHVGTLRRPIIFFQGTEDKVVPPSQAQVMYDAVVESGQPTTLVMFEGEQHGFRQAPNIRRALDSELTFYGMCFGFTPADKLDEPLVLVNSDASRRAGADASGGAAAGSGFGDGAAAGDAAAGE